VLGLDRETGSFRLGFEIHVGDTGLLTSGDINGGWLYLTDGETLFITALSPHAAAAMDCPAVPFPHPALFDQPELATMEMQLPVSATLPSALSHYPGGRWPEFGYGVLDGLILSDAPYSDTVRAAAPGTISRIVVDPPPLLEADFLVISNTRRIPPELGETLWGNQVWIDHGNGIQTRYGGLSILPSLQKGQTVHRLAILGYAGDGPVLFGLWANDVYLGYAGRCRRPLPATVRFSKANSATLLGEEPVDRFLGGGKALRGGNHHAVPADGGREPAVVGTGWFDRPAPAVRALIPKKELGPAIELGRLNS